MLANRLREALQAIGIQASLGYSMRVPSEGLQRAWEEADKVNSIGRCNNSTRRSCNGCFETTSV